MFNVLSNLFRKPCPMCKEHLECKHELRMDTSEGVMQLMICDNCASFLEVSSDVLSKKKGKENE